MIVSSDLGFVLNDLQRNAMPMPVQRNSSKTLKACERFMGDWCLGFESCSPAVRASQNSLTLVCPPLNFALNSELICVSKFKVQIQTSGRNFASSKVVPRLTLPRTISSGVHVLSASVSVKPLILAKIQKPESFIHEPMSEPAPMAVAR